MEKEITIEYARKFLDKYPDVLKLTDKIIAMEKKKAKLLSDLRKALEQRAEKCKKLLDRSEC